MHLIAAVGAPRAVGEQHFSDTEVIFERSDHERRYIALVARVGVSARRHKQLADAEMAVEDCPVQRRGVVAVARIDQMRAH